MGAAPRSARCTKMRLVNPLLIISLFVLLSCQADQHAEKAGASATDNEPSATHVVSTPGSAGPPHAPRHSPMRASAPLAAALIRAEWAKADNRPTCAPVAFTADGGAPAEARRAHFSGGWAVAFDTPEVRSAYGIAGVGALDTDVDPPAAQERRLRDQWPYFMALPKLPAPAFSGLGVGGGAAYPADNPDGLGLQSVAYVRIGGQACDYNVWSRLGRAHLEALLRSLRKL